MNNRELVESFYQDDRKLFGAMAPDIEWHEMEGLPYGGTYRGAEEIMEGVFRHIGADWEAFAATPTKIMESGDHVITLGHYSGIFKATGKPMRSPFAHVYTLRGGRIVEFRQYGDSAQFVASMT